MTAAFWFKALIVHTGSRPGGGGQLILIQGHSAGEQSCWDRSPVFWLQSSALSTIAVVHLHTIPQYTRSSLVTGVGYIVRPNEQGGKKGDLGSEST